MCSSETKLLVMTLLHSLVTCTDDMFIVHTTIDCLKTALQSTELSHKDGQFRGAWVTLACVGLSPARRGIAAPVQLSAKKKLHNIHPRLTYYDVNPFPPLTYIGPISKRECSTGAARSHARTSPHDRRDSQKKGARRTSGRG